MKKEVKHAGFGDPFDHGGVRWVALDIDGGKVFAVAEKALFQRPFDRDNRADWGASSLRLELNTKYLNALIESGARIDQFTERRVDLSALDGTRAGANALDRVSMLTADQYRKYRGLLPDAGDRFWLVTPWTSAEDFEGIACGVEADGTLGNCGAGFGDWGVRPTVWLDGETVVDFAEAAEERTRSKSLEEMLTDAVVMAAAGNSVRLEITINARPIPAHSVGF